MNRIVTKGIITAAGYGTRFLPATKNVPKELLPIIDTPIIHYVVEEFVNSGIKDIIIVTRYGSHAIEDYFDSLFELETFLKNTKKYEKLEKIRQTYKMANFAFIRQHKDLPYGNASPLLAAKSYIGNDNFALAFGDDIFVSEEPGMLQVKNAFINSDATLAMAVKQIPRKEMSKYGMVLIKKGTENIVEKIVEKPEYGTVDTNLAEFGRIILSPNIFNYLDVKKTGINKELWLIDAIDRMSKKEKVIAQKVEGEWLTTGDPLKFLKATVELALRRDDLKGEFMKYLKKRVNK